MKNLEITENKGRTSVFQTYINQFKETFSDPKIKKLDPRDSPEARIMFNIRRRGYDWRDLNGEWIPPKAKFIAARISGKPLYILGPAKVVLSAKVEESEKGLAIFFKDGGEDHKNTAVLDDEGRLCQRLSYLQMSDVQDDKAGDRIVEFGQHNMPDGLVVSQKMNIMLVGCTIGKFVGGVHVPEA
jgi:hypothetical protein